MRAIVDGVACDDETNRGDVKAGGVICICVADIHSVDRISFEAQGPAVERLGNCQAIWDLSGKPSFPVFNGLRCKSSLHGLDHLRQGKRAGRRKAIAQELKPKKWSG